MTVAELQTIDTIADRVAALGFDFDAMPKQDVTQCPLCGGAASELVSKRDRYGLPQQARICTRCSLVYLSPRLTEAAYWTFYERWYRPLVDIVRNGSIPAERDAQARASRADWMCKLLAPFVTSPACQRTTLLDVGGSRGDFAAEAMKRFGLKATVLDPSEDELAEAAEHGCETIHGFAETTGFGPHGYGVVSLLQTVDHLLDFGTVLEKVRNYCAPYGVALIDFVNWRAVQKVAGVERALKVDHPMNFTPVTAMAAMRRYGLEPMQASKTQDDRYWAFVCRPVEPIYVNQPDEWWLPARDVVERELAEVL